MNLKNQFTIDSDSKFVACLNELHRVCASLNTCKLIGHHSPYLEQRLTELQEAIREYSKRFKPVVIPPNPQFN